MKLSSLYLSAAMLLTIAACNRNTTKTDEPVSPEEQHRIDSIERVKALEKAERERPRTANDIKLEKELTYDKHTLEDTYPYEDTTRVFQWDKIKEKLAEVENFQRMPHIYGVLQNQKNKNGEAPLVENWHRNAYKRVSDSLETERWQSAPLYREGKHDIPIIYGRDGFLVSIESPDTLEMVKVKGISFDGTWEVPKRYLYPIGDTVEFNVVALVDLTNQNICTLEKVGDCDWRIRSMNPATSGKHNPPYAMETPNGIFVVQEKKKKMFFVKDGTSTIQGYAPTASRFTNGAYIHGVPVNNPNGKIIEYSWSLGTTPRSHMCVRNASSHAEFVYNLAKTYQSLVIVID